MELRIASWIVFAICSFFAFYTVFLPFDYFTTAPGSYHRSDNLVGWAYMTLFGFFPSVFMIVLLFIQRKKENLWLKLIWAAPVLIIASSALFMKFAKY
jgi:hypothetical protein